MSPPLIHTPLKAVLNAVVRKLPGPDRTVGISKEKGQWIIQLGETKSMFITLESPYSEIIEKDNPTVEEAERLILHIFGQEGIEVWRENKKEFITND